VKRVDISGFGGAYENACQRMLTIGLEWIKDKPIDIWKEVWGYKNIFGMMHTPEEFRDLEEKWIKEVAPSGAMHQAVLSHLYYIHKFGYDAWLEKGKDRIIEYEENNGGVA